MAYVMGVDNRREAGPHEADSAAVRQTGMLRIQGEEFVSAVLTGANCDLVLSAGHAAVYWEDIERKAWRKGAVRGQGQFRFKLAVDSAADWQRVQVLATGYAEPGQVGQDEHDWAIFRAEAPLMQDCEVLELLPETGSCRAGLLMVGFHFDRPTTRLLDPSCGVKQRPGKGVVVHDCDSKDGSSGAPLFCRDNGKLRLLGINISGLTRRDYYDAGEYGKAGLAFHERRHKNFAITVHGQFRRALMTELRASLQRRQLRLGTGVAE